MAAAPASSGDGVAPTAFARWAIVAAPRVQKSGLADLLTVKLAEEPGLTLVERDQIAAGTKELALDQALGAEAAGQRLKLGKLLKADALLFLADAELAAEPRDTSQASGQRGPAETSDQPGAPQADGPRSGRGKAADAGPVARGRFTRVVISESTLGARLRTDFLLHDPGKAEVAAEQIVSLVRDTRSRFPQGVQRIIGVPSFVNRDLTHEYDYLQDQLAYVLQNGLAAWPGQAVLEVEEARAIQRELDIAGNKLAQRIVPCFIEGEYRTTPATSAATQPAVTPASAPTANMPVFVAHRPAAIDLTLVVKDATGVRETVQQHDDLLEALAAWLQREASQRLLPVLGTAGAASQPRIPGATGMPATQPSLTDAQQLALLASRAETFARLGDYEHSTALREACLLIWPDAAVQHRALATEYIRLLRPDWVTRQDAQTRERWLRLGCERWRLALQHLHCAVRARCIVREQFTDCSYEFVQAMRDFAAWGADRQNAALIRKIDPGLPQQLAADFASVEAQRRAFVLATYPLVASLPYRNGSVPAEALGDVAVYTLADYAPYGYAHTHGLMYGQLDSIWTPFPQSNDDLVYLLRVFDTIAREHTSFYLNVPKRILFHASEHTRPGAFSEAEFRSFAQTLARSKFLPSRFVGEASQPVYDFVNHSPRDAAAASALLAALQALENDLYSLLPVTSRAPGYDLNMEPLYERLRELANVDQPSAASERQADLLRETGPAKTLHLATTRFRFEWRNRERRPVAPLHLGADERVFRCHAGLDVFWNGRHVALHRAPRILEPVLKSESGDFVDVGWDGRFVWVAERNTGVHLLDPDTGDALALYTATDGLPPADCTMRLHGVRPGEALVVGCFGKERRAWCAMLQWREGQTAVNVFHQAARTLTPDDPQLVVMSDPSVAFTPVRIVEYRPPNRPGKRLFVVFRDDEFRPGELRLHNLVIDPDTLDVQVLPHRYPVLFGDYLAYLKGGDGLFNNVAGRKEPLIHLAALGRRCANGAPWELVPSAPFSYSRVVIPYGGYVYVYTVGNALFHRFDFQTETTVKVAESTDGNPESMANYRASMLLGVIALRDSEFYQLRVEDPDARPGTLSGRHELIARDSQSGQPLVGATVEFDAGGSYSTDKSDSRGQCAIDLGADAPAWLSAYAWKEGYGARELVLHNDAAARESDGRHVIALEPLTTVGGVIRTSTGQPLPGAQVFLVDGRLTAPAELVPTSEDSAYAISGLRPYDYVAYTDAEGRWRENLFRMVFDDLRLRVVYPSVPKGESEYRKLDAEQLRDLRAGKLTITVRVPSAPGRGG
jgi:hypothetical protein